MFQDRAELRIGRNANGRVSRLEEYFASIFQAKFVLHSAVDIDPKGREDRVPQRQLLVEVRPTRSPCKQLTQLWRPKSGRLNAQVAVIVKIVAALTAKQAARRELFGETLVLCKKPLEITRGVSHVTRDKVFLSSRKKRARSAKSICGLVRDPADSTLGRLDCLANLDAGAFAHVNSPLSTAGHGSFGEETLSINDQPATIN